MTELTMSRLLEQLLLTVGLAILLLLAVMALSQAFNLTWITLQLLASPLPLERQQIFDLLPLYGQVLGYGTTAAGLGLMGLLGGRRVSRFLAELLQGYQGDTPLLFLQKLFVACSLTVVFCSTLMSFSLGWSLLVWR
jgi:hypothetical protein